MASGIQLATAYISLNVRTDGIKKQVSSALDAVGGQGRQVGTSIGSNIAAGIRSHMGSGTLSTMIFAPMELAGVRWAVRAGKAIGSALRTAIAGAIGGLGLGAIFGAGGILAAGLDRLKTLQQSTVQLSLKLKPEDIKNLQNDVKAAVEGTPISLDKAMQAVPKAISAGLNSGEVKQLITDLANLTASTGGQASFEQLSVIMEQVRSKTKLTGEEMQQLVDAGVDVRGILKEAFGYDDKTLEKNLKKGKIGANELQQAIQKVYGSVRNADGSFGLAKRMGETFDGAIGNLKASASRLGANFIAAVLGKKADEDPLKDFALGLGNVTEILNTMGAWVTTHRDDIHNVFVRAKDGAVLAYNGVKNVVDWFGKLKQTGQDVGTRIGDAFDDVTAAVDRLWNKINDVVGKVKSGVEGIVTKIKDFVSTAFNSVFGADTPLGKLLAQLGIGMPTASAAATPGGPPGFNPGPMAPGVAAGQTPLSSSGQGLSSVPRFGYDANGNPLTSTSGRGGGLTAKIPGQSAVGAPIYSGAVTEDTGGAVEPRTAMIQDLIQQKFGDTGAYIGNDYRKPDGPNEHSSGQAADIMVNELGKRSDESIALGNKINKWLIENAAKIGLQYTIWNGMLYRPDGSTQPNPGQGITGNHEDHVHYRVIPGKVDELPQFSSGGPVWGAGTGTSDSIPAMLSNGEHVLTAAEVNKMGGQSAVYGFRKALNAGMIPGFAPGGAVDPNQIQDLNDKLADLNNQALVAKAQFDDVMSNDDASESEKMRVAQQLQQTQRQLQQAQTDLPIIAAGGTPPDRSAQNRVFDTTDRLALAQQAQADMNAADDVSVPQKLQTDYAVVQAQRERDQAVAELQGKGTTTDYGGEFLRTMGFIPANAGNTGVAGTSSLSSFIGMGNDVVGGLIDTGASLAQTAASAAMAGASFGGSAAAGPAAGMATSYGIQLAASTAKRLSSYGFQMASIGADSLVEQLFPFGAPRWLGYDYTGFAPQLNVMGAATSTLEKMGSDAIQKYFNPAGNQPIIPPAPQAPAPDAAAAPQPAPPTPFNANQELIGPDDPRFVQPPMNPLTPGGGGGSWAKGGAIGVYDNGGILKPGQLAFNASRTPENILTKQQWNSMAASASTPAKGGGPLVENLYAQDMQDAIRQLEKVKRRDMMQYSGRP